MAVGIHSPWRYSLTMVVFTHHGGIHSPWWYSLTMEVFTHHGGRYSLTMAVFTHHGGIHSPWRHSLTGLHILSGCIFPSPVTVNVIGSLCFVECIVLVAVSTTEISEVVDPRRPKTPTVSALCIANLLLCFTLPERQG